MNQHRRDLNSSRIAELNVEADNCLSIAESAITIGDTETARELIARAAKCVADRNSYTAANLRA